MILYPRNSPPHGLLPAWQAVEESQRQAATEWWLIAQPDHAALAGDLAARIQSPLFPVLDPEIIQAISLHDEGWRTFDCSAVVKNGRPLSFLEIPVPDFLRAWRDSIQRAEEVAPIGGILVSEHFCRLGKFGLTREFNAPDAELLNDFLREEECRQQSLKARQDHSGDEISVLVDVLQFCDLLSLYLCCGSRRDVEFPQTFRERHIRLKREAELCRTDPSLFGQGISLAVTGRGYPDSRQSVSIPVLLS